MPNSASGKRSFQGVSRMAQAIGGCQAQAIKYGQCISAKFNDVERGMCQQEFLNFKYCVTQALKRK